MLEELIIFSFALFITGAIGFLTRRNIFLVLMSLEIMLNSASLLFFAGSLRWGNPEGFASILVIIALAASEAGVGLAIFLALYRVLKTEKVDEWKILKG